MHVSWKDTNCEKNYSSKPLRYILACSSNPWIIFHGKLLSFILIVYFSRRFPRMYRRNFITLWYRLVVRIAVRKIQIATARITFKYALLKFYHRNPDSPVEIRHLKSSQKFTATLVIRFSLERGGNYSSIRTRIQAARRWRAPAKAGRDRYSNVERNI